MRKRPRQLTEEQLLSAYGKMNVPDQNLIREGAATAAIKTGLGTHDIIDLLAKVGMYMLENPGVKK